MSDKSTSQHFVEENLESGQGFRTLSGNHPVVQYSDDVQARIDAIEGHKYDDDDHDEMMKKKMKDHPKYKDQLQNGIWWDTKKMSIHRWNNYKN